MKKAKEEQLINSDDDLDDEDLLLTETIDELNEEELLNMGDKTKKNSWGIWAQNLCDESKKYFEQKGSDLNVYLLEHVNVSKKLLKDLELFPVWGNIQQNQFEYGRVPASSASVESAFSIVKTFLMSKVKHLMRVDEFVDLHIDYLEGKISLILADLLDQNNTTDMFETINTEQEQDKCSICQKNCTNNLRKYCTVCENIICKACSITNESKIICKVCSKKDIIVQNIALSETEKWGGFSTAKEKCKLCAAGNYPGGAHKCDKCSKAVHIIDINCSVPVSGGEEGYGQLRRCIDCTKENLKDTRNSEKQRTNEKKLTKKANRRPSKYLGKRPHDIADSLNLEHNKPL